METEELRDVNRPCRRAQASYSAKTEEGKKVLARLEELRKKGNIGYGITSPGEYANHDSGKITISTSCMDDPNQTASHLVHEGTHAYIASDSVLPTSLHRSSIDEEQKAMTNQDAFYREQEDEFQDDELTGRHEDIENGTLRKSLHEGYPNLPEH